MKFTCIQSSKWPITKTWGSGKKGAGWSREGLLGNGSLLSSPPSLAGWVPPPSHGKEREASHGHWAVYPTFCFCSCCFHREAEVAAEAEGRISSLSLPQPFLVSLPLQLAAAVSGRKKKAAATGLPILPFASAVQLLLPHHQHPRKKQLQKQKDRKKGLMAFAAASPSPLLQVARRKPASHVTRPFSPSSAPCLKQLRGRNMQATFQLERWRAFYILKGVFERRTSITPDDQQAIFKLYRKQEAQTQFPFPPARSPVGGKGEGVAEEQEVGVAPKRLGMPLYMTPWLQVWLLYYCLIVIFHGVIIGIFHFVISNIFEPLLMNDWPWKRAAAQPGWWKQSYKGAVCMPKQPIALFSTVGKQSGLKNDKPIGKLAF